MPPPTPNEGFPDAPRAPRTPRSIARVGVDERAAGAACALACPPRPRLIDPYVGFIDETLNAHPRLRATRLFDMLRMRGFEGGIAILRRHVAEVRPVPRGEVYLRTERLIGEQAQVDWAHVGKMKLPGVTGAIHRLRHTFCSMLAAEGAPAGAVQKLAGHASLSTTNRYMHLSPTTLDAAIGLLARAFGEGVEKGAVSGA